MEHDPQAGISILKWRRAEYAARLAQYGSFGTGTEYRWLKLSSHPDWDLALRAGYNHSQTPVPDKNFNPAFPDSNVHVLSFGFGLTCHPGGKFLGIKDCGQPDQKTLIARISAWIWLTKCYSWSHAR